MPKKPGKAKVIMPNMRTAFAEQFGPAGAINSTFVEMQKTHAQTFGQCHGFLSIGTKKFLKNAQFQKGMRARAVRICSKMDYLGAITAMCSHGLGIPQNQSAQAANFMLTELHNADAKGNSDIIGRIEQWKTRNEKAGKSKKRILTIEPAYLQRVKFVILGQLRKAMGEKSYSHYLQFHLPWMESAGKGVAMSNAIATQMFPHN